MQQLLPVVLEWLSDAPDPDLGLLQLRRLAEGTARAGGARRYVPRLARRGGARLPGARLEPVLGDALRRQPDFVADARRRRDRSAVSTRATS